MCTHTERIFNTREKVLLKMFKIDQFMKTLSNDKLYPGSSSFRWLLAPFIFEPEVFIIFIEVNVWIKQ